MGKIILTSSGLDSDAIIKHIKDNGTKAAIIPTAHDQKEKSPGSLKAEKVLREIGYTVDIIDLEFEDAKRLLSYDLIYLTGGNPFYLMYFLKKKNVRELLAEILLRDNGIIAGSSAGSIVLGTTIKLPYIFTPDLFEQKPLDDFLGLNLVDINVCPHYDKFPVECDDIDKKIVDFENDYNISIIRLNDGEAVVWVNGLVQRI